jgi:hypothetical protein
MKPPYVKILFFTLICIYNSFYFAQGCKNIYDYTGNSQEYVVPPGVSSITVKMWGAGGGSGDNRNGGNGGGGAYITGILNVIPGETYKIRVGQGGLVGTVDATGNTNMSSAYGGGGKGRSENRGGGGGGGRSWIRLSNDLTEIASAAGGGGGGGSGNCGGFLQPACNYGVTFCGGGGGALSNIGLRGGDRDGCGIGSGGCGGSSSSGGACTNANNGSQYSGSNGEGNGNQTYGGGGGGGGYYGGEGGNSGTNNSGGGGGGSSYMIGFTSTSSNAGSSGSSVGTGSGRPSAGNWTDTDNGSSFGGGGNRGTSPADNSGQNGQNGRIVIIANQIAALPAITSTTQTIGVGSSTAYSNSYPNGTWSSSNTSIASVNSSGTVSGVSAGTIDITYTYTINNPNQSGCTATLSVSRSITVIQGLPVELTQFETECLADNNIAHIFWTTASENNSSYYQVQRSHDANDWQTIAEVQAAGNSTEQIYYEITEAITWRELYTYYRLMQYDMDHSVNIYGPISIQCSNHRSNFKVFPNPFSGEVNIELSDNMAIDGIRLVRPDGTLLFVAQPQEIAGQFYKVDLSHIGSGAYVLEAYLQGELQLRERIVKY